MRNLQLFHRCGVLFLVASGLACNAPTAENCARPVGIYEAQFAFVAGTCQSGYQPMQLTFDADDAILTSRSVRRFADTVTTEITLMGCEVSLKQSVTGGEQHGEVRSALSGVLAVDDEILTGLVVRTDYGADMAVQCSAQYEALYTRDGLLLGAAARD